MIKTHNLGKGWRNLFAFYILRDPRNWPVRRCVFITSGTGLGGFGEPYTVGPCPGSDLNLRRVDCHDHEPGVVQKNGSLCVTVNFAALMLGDA